MRGTRVVEPPDSALLLNSGPQHRSHPLCTLGYTTFLFCSFPFSFLLGIRFGNFMSFFSFRTIDLKVLVEFIGNIYFLHLTSEKKVCTFSTFLNRVHGCVVLSNFLQEIRLPLLWSTFMLIYVSLLLVDAPIYLFKKRNNRFREIFYLQIYFDSCYNGSETPYSFTFLPSSFQFSPP